jgi:hypothetical protein
VVPITDAAISRVEALALHEDQPLLQNSGLVVEWGPNHLVDDSEYDLDFFPSAAVDDVSLSPSFFAPVNPSELSDLHSAAFSSDPLPPVVDQGAHLPDVLAHDTFTALPAITEDPEASSVLSSNYDDPHIDDDITPTDSDDDVTAPFDDDVTAQFSNTFPPPAQGASPNSQLPASSAIHQGAQPYNLRKHPKRTTRLNTDMDLPHSTKTYSAPAQFVQTHAQQEQRLIFGHVFTQMSVKAAIKKHGSAAVDAMMA